MRRLIFVLGLLVVTAALFLLVACESARLPVEAGMGANPQLPPPRKPPIPVVEVATAKGWPAGAMPTAAAGWRVNAFATELDHPRWLYVLPNGDVLVAEASAPPKPEEKGMMAMFMRYFFKQAGSAVPSANRITLLRDADGDGVAETKTPFLTNLFSPFGMALVGDTLYVANADALMRFPYRDGETSISAPGTKVADLPAGINHHWTKSLVANRDGSRLYVGVGSNSNVAEKGMEVEVNRANILEIDPSNGNTRVFASGLRNPVGLAWQPASGALWTAVNERDDLGSDLVPDYMTSVKDGGFYGWPYSYFGQHVDDRVKPQRPDLVAKAIVPDYALGPHTASLGLTFDDRGAYIGQHGSWNRRPRSGYRVIFVPFTNGMPAGDAQEVLTDFLDNRGNARGRPVGVIFDKRGALLVADDVGNVVWRATH